MGLTLEQAQAKHAEQVDQNRALGVIDYDAKQPLSDRVFEVTDGYKYLPSGDPKKPIRLGPGQRFRPTVQQVENGSLRGKAREISATEYAGIHRHERKPMSTGADIGLRGLPMTSHALRLALDEGLTEADFAGVEPEPNGYTKGQVEEILARRAA